MNIVSSLLPTAAALACSEIDTADDVDIDATPPAIVVAALVDDAKPTTEPESLGVPRASGAAGAASSTLAPPPDAATTSKNESADALSDDCSSEVGVGDIIIIVVVVVAAGAAAVVVAALAALYRVVGGVDGAPTCTSC